MNMYASKTTSGCIFAILSMNLEKGREISDCWQVFNPEIHKTFSKKIPGKLAPRKNVWPLCICIVVIYKFDKSLLIKQTQGKEALVFALEKGITECQKFEY